MRLHTHDTWHNIASAFGLARSRETTQHGFGGAQALMLLLASLLALAGAPTAHAQEVETTLPSSQRQTINLAAGIPQYIGNASTTSNCARKAARPAAETDH